MKTNLDEAYEWANKSYELFKKSEGEDGKNTKLLALYVEVLRNRIRSDKNLTCNLVNNIIYSPNYYYF